MGKFSVQIQNYQIIENARIDFNEGLTVIVGPSNNGKSAIFRAIEAAIYNKVGNSFIKSGTDSTAVGIKTDEHVVIWKKSSDSGVYKVDGQTYNKIGRGQLVEVADALHISEIEVSSDKVRLNLLKQMEYPFLLDKNPSQLFEFLSMSNEGDKLSSIFQTMRSDLRKTNSDIDITVGKIDSINDVIVREEGILTSYASIETVANKVISYDSLFNQYGVLNDLIISLNEKKQKLIRLRQSILQHRTLTNILTTNVDKLDKSISEVSALSSLILSIKDRRSTLLNNKAHIEHSRSTVDFYNNVLNSIDPSSIVDLQSNILSIKSSLSSLLSKRSSLSQYSANILSIKSSLKSTESTLSQFNACPLCGQPLPHSH